MAEFLSPFEFERALNERELRFDDITSLALNFSLIEFSTDRFANVIEFCSDSLAY